MHTRLTNAGCLAGTLMLSLTLAACGGGDGGGETTPAPTGQVSVSGAVQAPGGQVALFSQPSLWERIGAVVWSEAVAALSGLSPVPDGTPVQLVRIDDAGNVAATLASTTVTGGRYFFNLTSLGLTPSSNLVVRVINSGTGAQLRAFVTGTTVDLDPISETALRLVLEQITLTPGTTLIQFTVTELRDIAGAVNQLATVKQLTAGLNVEATVSAIKTAAASEAGLTAFVVAAAGPGETTEGPGDIGNYFPLTQGNTWQFQGTHSESGQPTVNFSNTMTVKGTMPVGAVMTTILEESNVLNTGTREDVYYFKDSRGLLNYGNNDPDDTLSPNLIPYRELVFPLNIGVISEVVNKRGVDFGQDLDSDGRNETADVLSQVTVEKFEDVTVPKGTFTNTAKVAHKTTITVFSSARFASVTVTSTQTMWFAPTLGPVKRTIVIQSGGQTMESSTEELVDTGKQILLATNDLIYAQHTGLIYASIPGSPGSIRSINPVTGDIGPQIPVGSEPLKLAISDNGQYLYVGLDGEGAVQRINLLTQTADLKFSLGSDPVKGPYYVEDIEVLPGNPQAVAVSRMVKGNFFPRNAGIAIYDNGVQRPDVVSQPTPSEPESNVIEFSQSPSTLYGFGTEAIPPWFNRIAVGASGASLTDSLQNVLTYAWDMKFDGGLIYTNIGQVLDPITRTLVGTFTLPDFVGPPLVRPDASIGRVYFLNIFSSGLPTMTFTIRAFDRSTFQLLGSFEVEDVPSNATSLVRWGPRGLAFRTSAGKVFLIESATLIQ